MDYVNAYIFNFITPQGQQKIKEDTNEAKSNDNTNIYTLQHTQTDIVCEESLG
jgi:hypothetical protein